MEILGGGGGVIPSREKITAFTANGKGGKRWTSLSERRPFKKRPAPKGERID